MLFICISFHMSSKISLLMFAWLRRHFYWIFCAQNIFRRKFSKIIILIGAGKNMTSPYCICWSRTCRLGRLAHPVSSLWSGQSYFPSQNWVLFRHLPLVHRKFSGQVTYRGKKEVWSKTCRLYTASFPGRPPTAGKTKCGQKLAARPPQVFQAGHLPQVKRSEVWSKTCH